MKVISIAETKINDCTIEVIVKISGKKDLILTFQGAERLPFINDCIFLTLYIQSMQEGTELVFPKNHPVSDVLVDNMAKHQQIFCQWYPKKLSAISTDVELAQCSPAIKGAVSLFSGGIDSFYTYVDKQEELTHVFLCLGLDIQLEEKEKIKLATEQYTAFAKANNKQLLIVSTNIRHVFPDGNRPIQHAALFSGLVIAYGLKVLYIPASHNIDELFPWGSHILTDPLLSNGVTKIVHHGAISRTAKTVVISQHQEAIDTIRICNSSEEFNCGECEKCIRTMFALAVLRQEAECLPPLSEKITFLKQVKIFKDSQYSFWLDNYQLAISHNQLQLANFARKIIRSYQWRQWLKQGIKLLRGK